MTTTTAPSCEPPGQLTDSLTPPQHPPVLPVLPPEPAMDTFTSPQLVTTPDEMSIGDLLADHANRTPEKVLVERLVDGSWRPVTAAEMHATATAIAKGLIASGIEAGDR